MNNITITDLRSRSFRIGETSGHWPVGDRPWIEQAACANADTNLFFPGQGDKMHEARTICMACPVREPCLNYALDNHETYGVWGGMSERARRKIRRNRNAA